VQMGCLSILAVPPRSDRLSMRASRACRARVGVGDVFVGKGKQDTPTSAVARRLSWLLSLYACSGRAARVAALLGNRSKPPGVAATLSSRSVGVTDGLGT
jgi:hypothetical protein